MRSVVLGGRLPGHHMVQFAHEIQWAYKQSNSTEMVKMTEYWRRVLDNNLVIKEDSVDF